MYAIPKNAILAAGPLLGIALFGAYWRLSHKRPAYAAPEPAAIALPMATILGSHPDFLGDSKAPYTLVEFADYQCPPCKSANAQLMDVLKHNKGKVRATFRNYPLPFHPQALPAALAAEAARLQGKFWPMHDALYSHQNTLGAAQIKALVDTLKLNKVRFAHDRIAAQKVIEADRKVADSFHLTGTPTFVLCCPDKRILHLSSLAQMAQYIK